MMISIVIPVYNAGAYLRRCLESVVAAMKGVEGEVLLVDNGSRDGSREIMREYQKKYPELVRVLRCDTRGASAARNLGAAKARGEYLWFIDADDEIDAGAVTKLLAAATRRTEASEKANMVMLGAERIYPDQHRDYLSAVRPSEPEFASRFVRYGVGPWQVMVRREWWQENGFAFREGMIHEDMELMSALILYVDGRYAAVDEPLYYYYQNEDSVLHKVKWDPHYLDIFPALEGLHKRFEKAGAAGEYHDELEWFFIWNLLIDSAKDFGKFPEGRVGFARTREMLKRYFPGWRRNRFLRAKPLKLRVRVRINYYKR